MEKHNKHLIWNTRNRRKLQEYSIFSVYSVQRESAEGTEGTFVQIDAPDWVTVIPLLLDEKGEKCFLMVKQYRHGNERITCEFPAGTVESEEPKQETAYRELLEETGYQAGKIIELGSVSPNPAFMNNSVTTFLATELVQVQDQELDEHEMIEVTARRINEVVAEMGSGMYDNGIMIISLYLYLKWAGQIIDA